MVTRTEEVRVVRLDVDAKDLERAARALNRSMGALNKQSRATTRQLTNLNKQARLVRNTFIGYQTINFGGALVNQLGEFEQAMSSVKAISGATASEFEQLTAQSRQLGATTAFTAKQAAEAQRFLAQAGFEVNAVLASTPATLQLAQAGMLDLGRAADITSNVLTGFRKSAAETGEVADILAKAAASSNTNIEQLGVGLSYVAPVAAGLKTSLEETTAAIGLLSNAGIQGERAGTSLRRILGELEAPGSAARRVFRELGIELDEIRPSAVGLEGALAELASEGFTVTEAMQAFGQRGGPAVGVLVTALQELDAEGQNALGSLTDALEESEGFAARTAATMDDNLAGSMRRLNSAAQELVLSVGDAGASGALRGLADNGATALRELATSMEVILPIAAAVTAGLLTIGAGATLSAIAATTGSITRLTAVVRALAVAVRLNPLTALAAVAVTTSVAVAGLRKEVAQTETTLGRAASALDLLANATLTEQGRAKEAAATQKALNDNLNNTSTVSIGAATQLANVANATRDLKTRTEALAKVQKAQAVIARENAIAQIQTALIEQKAIAAQANKALAQARRTADPNRRESRRLGNRRAVEQARASIARLESEASLANGTLKVFEEGLKSAQARDIEFSSGNDTPAKPVKIKPVVDPSDSKALIDALNSDLDALKNQVINIDLRIAGETATGADAVTARYEQRLSVAREYYATAQKAANDNATTLENLDREHAERETNIAAARNAELLNLERKQGRELAQLQAAIQGDGARAQLARVRFEFEGRRRTLADLHREEVASAKARGLEVQTINERFRDVELQNEERFEQDKKDLREAVASTGRALDISTTRDPFARQELESVDRFERQRLELEQWRADRIAISSGTASELETIEHAHAARMARIEKQRADEARSIALANASFQIETAASLTSSLTDLVRGIAGENSKAYKAIFRVNQAFAIADATVKGAQAINTALASSSPPFNFVKAAAVGAASAVQIGTIATQKFATGGYVEGAGTGTSDSINAMLSNGEFVINASSVKAVGRDTLERINSISQTRRPPERFATGGYVGPRNTGGVSRVTDSAPTQGAPTTMNFNIHMTATSDPVDAKRQASDAARAVEGVVLKVLREQGRPGGLLRAS